MIPEKHACLKLSSGQFKILFSENQENNPTAGVLWLTSGFFKLYEHEFAIVIADLEA